MGWMGTFFFMCVHAGESYQCVALTLRNYDQSGAYPTFGLQPFSCLNQSALFSIGI